MEKELNDNAKAVKALATMYALGRLNAPLMLDNDHVSVYDDPEAQSPAFEMHPQDLLEACLDLLLIPHEYV